MADVLVLIVFSAIMWLAHRALCTLLAGKFSSTKTDGFRFVHAILMSLLLITMVTIYGRLREAIIGLVAAIVIIAGTALVLDLINLFVYKKSKLDLDLAHYLTGYAVIITVLIVL